MKNLNKVMWIDCNVPQICRTDFVCIHGQSRTPVPTTMFYLKVDIPLAFSSGRRCWACEADEVFYNGYPVERHDKRLYFLKNTTFPLIANRTATIAHLIRRLKAPPSPTGEGLLRRSFWQPTNMLQNLKLTTLPKTAKGKELPPCPEFRSIQTLQINFSCVREW